MIRPIARRFSVGGPGTSFVPIRAAGTNLRPRLGRSYSMGLLESGRRSHRNPQVTTRANPEAEIVGSALVWPRISPAQAMVATSLPVSRVRISSLTQPFVGECRASDPERKTPLE